MQRRKQQCGSIVQKSGKWYVRFYKEISENGVLARKKFSHCLGDVEGRMKSPPPAIIEDGENYVRAQLSSKLSVERSGLSVERFVGDVYLPLIRETKRPATAAQMTGVWNRHLKPQVFDVDAKRLTLGYLLVADAETYHIQALLDAIAATPKEPLSASQLKQCKFLLSGAFRLALQRGYRATAQGHPVENCCIPARAKRSTETHAYTSDQILVMLRTLPEPARTIVQFAAETGLRVAELRGVRWEDLNGDTLTVNRSVWKNHVSEPKTQASQAPVAIPRHLQQALEMLRARDGSQRPARSFAPL